MRRQAVSMFTVVLLACPTSVEPASTTICVTMATTTALLASLLEPALRRPRWLPSFIEVHAGCAKTGLPMASWQSYRADARLHFGLSKNCWRIIFLSKDFRPQQNFGAKTIFRLLRGKFNFWASTIFTVGNLQLSAAIMSEICDY